MDQREKFFSYTQLVISICLKTWGLMTVVNLTLASATKLDCFLFSPTCPSPVLLGTTIWLPVTKDVVPLFYFRVNCPKQIFNFQCLSHDLCLGWRLTDNEVVPLRTNLWITTLLWITAAKGSLLSSLSFAANPYLQNGTYNSTSLCSVVLPLQSVLKLGWPLW